MDDGALGARCDDDEIAVPRGQLLERDQDLLTLRSAFGAADVLLGLAVGKAPRPAIASSAAARASAPRSAASAVTVCAAAAGSKAGSA